MVRDLSFTAGVRAQHSGLRRTIRPQLRAASDSLFSDTPCSASYGMMCGYSGRHMASRTCCWIGSRSSSRASPCSAAVVATARATAAETTRRVSHRRQQCSADGVRIQSGDCVGGGGDHPIADPGGLDDRNTKTEAWEDHLGAPQG